MLKQSGRAGQRLSETARSSQRGVVLLVALIVLVALTLSGVALIRSVDTANLIAGNQAFHQSAVHASERSTEAAITWLGANPPPFVNAATDGTTGYLATRDDRIVTAGVPETWDVFWNRTTGVTPAVTVAPAPDAAGNTTAYVIHRLCGQTGPPQDASSDCAKPPPANNNGGSQQGGITGNLTIPSVYYRITTRVQGPRNTVAYLQTIVAL